jgi:hypothetical protein
MRADVQRRRLPFGSFLRGYTVARLERSLADAGHSVTRNAIYSWLSGATVPTLPHAAVIIRASRGTITVFDLLKQRERMQPVNRSAGNGTDAPSPKTERSR